MEFTGDPTHQAFQKRLIASKKAVAVVANWFKKASGYNVEIFEQDISPSFEDRDKFKDDGDLCIWKDDGPKMVIEVKGVNIDFTSGDDFPKHLHYIIDGKKSFDDKKEKPFAYICCNKALTHIGIVKISTFSDWKLVKLEYKTGEKMVTKDFYHCDFDLVEFIKLP